VLKAGIKSPAPSTTHPIEAAPAAITYNNNNSRRQDRDRTVHSLLHIKTTAPITAVVSAQLDLSVTVPDLSLAVVDPALAKTNK